MEARDNATEFANAAKSAIASLRDRTASAEAALRAKEEWSAQESVESAARVSAAESQLAAAKASACAATADAAALRRALDTRAARIAAITLEIEAGAVTASGGGVGGGDGAKSFFEFRAAVAAGLRGASSSPVRSAAAASALPSWATPGATAALVTGSISTIANSSVEEADVVFRANIIALRAASVYCARLESALASSRADVDALSLDRSLTAAGSPGGGAAFRDVSNGRQSPGGASPFGGVAGHSLQYSPPKELDAEAFSALKQELAAVNDELSEARAGLREASDQLSESARVLGALLDTRSPSPRKR